MSQRPAAARAQSMPYMSTSGASSKKSGSMMPLRTVLVTPRPRRSAPANSMTPAMHVAWKSVSVLEPTEVAKALATSLAPMP